MENQLNLTPVVLCGGAGTRLWPLSRKRFPKQFAPVPSPGGTGSNLFRATLERATSLAPERVLLLCSEDARFFVSDNLSGFKGVDFSILVEPVSRNTAPAIALAAFDLIEHDGDGLMLVLPSDHVVSDRDGFAKAVHAAASAAREGMLATFGVVPERAETGYGYVRRGEVLDLGAGEVYRAAAFHEKPDLATAQRWLESGEYYWNSGMFLFKASAYLEQLRAVAPEIHAACEKAYAGRTPNLDFVCAEREAFEACPDISVDYAVMEKAGNVALVPAKIGWSDVGSWEALAPLLDGDGDGNASAGDVVFADASNNVVYAGGRLVAVLGVDDCIIAETSDAVLVAQRGKAQEVKRMVEKLRGLGRVQATEHRKVYRPWGSYESVDAAAGFQVKRIVVNPGQSLSLQLHHRRSEHWVVVRGEVLVTRGDERFTLRVNESTYIPVETKHRLENPGTDPAHLIEVQCGDYLGEDDIERFEDNYGRTGES